MKHRLGFFGSFVYVYVVTAIVHITVARKPTFLDSVWWTMTVMSGIWTAAVIFYLSCAIVGGVLHFIRGRDAD